MQAPNPPKASRRGETRNGRPVAPITPDASLLHWALSVRRRSKQLHPADGLRPPISRLRFAPSRSLRRTWSTRGRLRRIAALGNSWLNTSDRNLGIIHTRWATHGKPTDKMPILMSRQRKIGVGHNVVIENYQR